MFDFFTWLTTLNIMSTLHFYNGIYYAWEKHTNIIGYYWIQSSVTMLNRISWVKHN